MIFKKASIVLISSALSILFLSSKFPKGDFKFRNGSYRIWVVYKSQSDSLGVLDHIHKNHGYYGVDTAINHNPEYCYDLVEKFTWKFSSDKKHLILNNYENYSKDSCGGYYNEYPAYTQYFKIIDEYKDSLVTNLDYEVYSDGSTHKVENGGENYIWVWNAKLTKAEKQLIY